MNSVIMSGLFLFQVLVPTEICPVDIPTAPEQTQSKTLKNRY